MKTIYIVRHCKAEGQAPDAGLTELGKQQAEQLTEFFHDKKIGAIVTSPFVRAVKTIEPFAFEHGIEVKLDDRLSERVLTTEERADWMTMLQQSFDDLELSYEGGESGKAAMERGVAVIKELIHQPVQNGVVVTHGNLMSLILKHFDDRIGFDEWKALTNPDVFLLRMDEDSVQLERAYT